MVHLAVSMYCNWPTDHVIDHSSIRLNRLTIQPVFNEVSLFTFSKGTHGFDITVPKNYLNGHVQLLKSNIQISQSGSKQISDPIPLSLCSKYISIQYFDLCSNRH